MGFFRARLPAQFLDSPVRDHLVCVHVRLGAGAGLPDDQREVVVELAVKHLVGGGNDRLSQTLLQRAEFHVCPRRRHLLNAKRPDQRFWHLFAADPEVLKRSLRLGPPIPVGGNAEFAHGVAFDPERRLLRHR